MKKYFSLYSTSRNIDSGNVKNNKLKHDVKNSKGHKHDVKKSKPYTLCNLFLSQLPLVILPFYDSPLNVISFCLVYRIKTHTLIRLIKLLQCFLIIVTILCHYLLYPFVTRQHFNNSMFHHLVYFSQ